MDGIVIKKFFILAKWKNLNEHSQKFHGTRLFSISGITRVRAFLFRKNMLGILHWIYRLCNPDSEKYRYKHLSTCIRSGCCPIWMLWYLTCGYKCCIHLGSTFPVCRFGIGKKDRYIAEHIIRLSEWFMNSPGWEQLSFSTGEVMDLWWYMELRGIW